MNLPKTGFRSPCYARHSLPKMISASYLLLLLLLSITATLLRGLGLLSPDTAGAATAEGRRESKVNVFLGVKTDDEGRDVDDLLADTNVTLTNKDTSVVDCLGEAEFVDTRLETTLQEILSLQGEHVI